MSALLDEATAVVRARQAREVARYFSTFGCTSPVQYEMVRGTYGFARLELGHEVEVLQLALWDSVPVLGRRRLRQVVAGGGR